MMDMKHIESDLQQFLDRLSLGESQDLEFKQMLPKGNQLSRTVTAMANTVGGWILLGVRDDGAIIGLETDLDKAQTTVSEAIQCVSPVPKTRIQIVRIDQKKLLVTRIERAPHPIFHTFEGAIYQRIGSVNRRLEGMSQLAYLRNHHILNFDESIDTDVSIDTIDDAQIQRFLESRNQPEYLKGHDISQFLINQKLGVLDSNQKVKFKNAGVLLFDKNPCEFFPQAEIKLVQFEGVDAVKIIAYKLVQTNLAQAIDQAYAFVLEHMTKKLLIEGKTQRSESYDYPPTVLRELIVNAVVHRDYFSHDAIQIYLFSDRLEVVSPGGLPEGLSLEKFGTTSVRRNPILYRILRDLRYIEGLGTGVPRIKNDMREAGLPDPVFLLESRFVHVMLRKKGVAKRAIYAVENLNERQKKGLVYLRENPLLKTKTYAEINQISYPTASADIAELVGYGFVKKVGAYRGAYYVLCEEG